MTAVKTDECPIGIRHEQQIRAVEDRVERLEESQKNNTEKLWQELTSIHKEMSAMRDEFSKELGSLRLEVSRRVPPWVTIVISLLTGLLGIAIGIASKVI